MAAWVAHAGAALLVPSGPYGDHLFVVLNQPAAFEGYGQRAVVLVNFSTIRAGLAFDNACVVEPGDHPFVRVRSQVYYRGARIEQARHIEECVTRGVYRLHQPVSQELLARIKVGVRISKLVAREIRGLPICATNCPMSSRSSIEWTEMTWNPTMARHENFSHENFI